MARILYKGKDMAKNWIFLRRVYIQKTIEGDFVEITKKKTYYHTTHMESSPRCKTYPLLKSLGLPAHKLGKGKQEAVLKLARPN